jgi:hypothetical protein
VLLLLQELFTAEAASEESSRAFLKSYSPYLISVLMVEQKQDELAAVASAMGATLGCLSVQLSTVDINGVPEHDVRDLQPQTMMANLSGITLQEWIWANCCYKLWTTYLGWHTR